VDARERGWTEVRRPRWSPDGSMLAFSYASEPPESQLANVDARTGRVVRLDVPAGTTAWSETGRCLYVIGAPKYWRRGCIFRVDVSDGSAAPVTTFCLPDAWMAYVGGCRFLIGCDGWGIFEVELPGLLSNWAR